ncbi:DUF2963 domain-containing protein [Candidatus Phytoplasma solani]|uniref:DUF2963 domain-containing protein n=1 Tax=Candidatus Phytoplasma solani TaxID=69896 RepID=UPI003590046B
MLTKNTDLKTVEQNKFTITLDTDATQNKAKVKHSDFTGEEEVTFSVKPQLSTKLTVKELGILDARTEAAIKTKVSELNTNLTETEKLTITLDPNNNINKAKVKHSDFAGEVEVSFIIVTKETKRRNDGTIESISEIDIVTEKPVRQTNFQSDGIKIKSITEFDPSTDKKVKQTNLQDNGNITSISEFKNGKEVKITIYKPDVTNRTVPVPIIDIIYDYDQNTDNSVKKIFYQSDGQTIWYINEYDKENDRLVKQTNYHSDGIKN